MALPGLGYLRRARSRLTHGLFDIEDEEVPREHGTMLTR